jgi:hypothetical protein
LRSSSTKSKDAVWVNGNSCQGQETRKWIGAKEGEVRERKISMERGKVLAKSKIKEE